MDPMDRESIRRNLVQLEQQTDLPTLLLKLLEKGVFADRMVEKYKSNATPLHIRKRELYMDIQTRGPLAFHKLLGALIETGHFDLARLLKPDVDIESYIAFLNIPPDVRRPEHRMIKKSAQETQIITAHPCLSLSTVVSWANVISRSMLDEIFHFVVHKGGTEQKQRELDEKQTTKNCVVSGFTCEGNLPVKETAHTVAMPVG